MRVRAIRPLIALAAAGAVLLAACGSPVTPTQTPAPTPSAAPTAAAPTAIATPTTMPTIAPTPSPSPSAAPTPTAVASTPIACQAANLVARITQWEGAMGHLIAHVELTNNGAACHLSVTARPQLVQANGAVLINSAAVASTPTVLFGVGAVLKTLVQDGNYCGPVPTAPVSVAFVFPSGGGRLIAQPLSATDVSGVPGCLSGPGSPGSIEMQKWAP